jgi:hypothetical protein
MRSIVYNGLAKFRGRFQREILSMRQVSKPSEIVYILSKPILIGLLVFPNCTKLSNCSSARMKFNFC